MQKVFENWQKFLNEFGAAGMGGNLATLSGAGRQPMAAVAHQQDSNIAVGDDLSKSVKVVIHRNGKVLLLRSVGGKHEGEWDLPGGHIKNDENILSALQREVFEETGLTISNPQDLNMNHGNKHFFCAQLPSDDIKLSEEHNEYGFFAVESIGKMNDVAEYFRQAIYKCMEFEVEEVKLLITIKI